MRAILIFLVSFLTIANIEVSAKIGKKVNRVLVFSLTTGYRHKSIKDGVLAIRKLGAQHHFEVDTSEDVNSFTEQNLAKYQSIVFLSPTGSNVFTDEQKLALRSYVNNGGGVLGIHAATDFCFEWEWYGKMMGAFFTHHPKIQEAKLVSVKPKDKLMKGLPQNWLHTDEWYNFKSFNKEVTVLLKVDETSYEGGKMDNDHPMVWYHNFEGGRVFYTGLGHTSATYSDPLFLKQLLAGLKWTMRK